MLAIDKVGSGRKNSGLQPTHLESMIWLLYKVLKSHSILVTGIHAEASWI